MKKFLIGLNIVIWSLVGYQVAHAAEPSKSTQKQAAAPKKNCDMLKDKNCNKPAPSANKPIPKKKKEDKAK
jgi:hypothetical protein